LDETMTLSAEPSLMNKSRAVLRPIDWVLIFCVTAAALSPMLIGPLSLLDDNMMLTQNARVHRLTADNLASHWLSPSFRIYMPLTLTIWNVLGHFAMTPLPGASVDATIHVLPFKLMSLIAHALAACVAGWAISQFVPRRWPAIVGGLLVGLHPFQVESVAWTTGLKDVLCGLFSFAVIGFYARFVQSPGDGHAQAPYKNRDWLLALGMMLLACASKPTAMTLPASLLVIDLLVRRRADVAERLLGLFAFALVAAVIAGIMLNTQNDPDVGRVAWYLQPLVAADSYAFYLKKIVLAWDFVQDYGRHPQWIFQSGVAWHTWIVPVVVLVGVLLTRSKVLLLALVFFVVPITPVSGIVRFDMQQYSTVTDHYMYTAMLGPGLAIALLLGRTKRAAVWVAVCVAVTALGVQTARQSKLWADDTSLLTHTLSYNPQSWMTRSMLGGVALTRGDVINGRRLSEEALSFNPRAAAALRNMIRVEAGAGKLALSADYARRVVESSSLYEASDARTLMIMATKINNRDLAEQGVRAWIVKEPGNPVALGILRDIRRAAAAEKAASQPAPAKK